MNKYIFYLFNLLLIASAPLAAQTLITTIKKPSNLITIDNLGSPIIVNQEEIVRYTKDGEFYQRTSNKLAGNISHLDASNSLKIIAFSKTLSQIQILDNKLGERGENLSLEQQGYQQVNAVCNSYNNGLWLYDILRFELIRLNQNMEEELSSGNLISQIGYVPEAVFMVERNKWLYMVDPENGILVFDIFGTFYKTIPIKGLYKVNTLNDVLFYLKNGQLYSYNQILVEEKLFLPDLKDIEDFSIHKERLIIKRGQNIMVYKL